MDWRDEAGSEAAQFGRAQDTATGGGSCASRTCRNVSPTLAIQAIGSSNQPFLRNIALLQFVVQLPQLRLQLRVIVGHC